jgi:enoyl-CoA hydratase
MTTTSTSPGASEFSSEVLEIERHGRTATLWLDRPAARNALGPAFWRDLPRAMAGLSADDDVRAIVVAARGPHFSVGLDLKAMLGGSMLADPPGTEATPNKPSVAARALSSLDQIRVMQASVTSVADCPKPVIAAVHGYCIGGGVDLVAACDIRLASADALFSVRETKVAIVADLGSLQRLPRIIGMGHVAELAYTGKDIDAARACRIGLVNEVLDTPEAVVSAARSLAEEIAANSPLAVQGTKAVLAAGDGMTVREGLEYVALWNAGSLRSDDLTEAMTAFLEKRPPEFTGR